MKNKKVLVSSSVLLVGVLITGYFIDNEPQITHMPSNIDEQIVAAKLINNQLLDDALSNNILKIEQKNVPSLEGIEPEAIVLTNDKGNLQVDESIKDLFEFYLSTIGEESLEQILRRIQTELSSQLESPALDQALSLLNRYVDYKIELASIEQELPSLTGQTNSNLENVKFQKTQLNALRERYFDEVEYQHFFAQEELYDNYMINHLEIVSDPTLDPETKRQNIESLEQTLPEEVKRLRQKVSLHGDLYERARNMKKEGANDHEIFKLREQSLGTDAALAMAQLDTDRALWKQRLTDYTEQRNMIVNSGLSQQDQLLAINDLIETNFSGSEILRVKALNSSL